MSTTRELALVLGLALVGCGPGVRSDPGAVGAESPGVALVAVGMHGRRVVIRDLRTVQATVEGGAADDPWQTLNDLAYADGLFVAVGGGCKDSGCRKRIVSFDGALWREAELPLEAQSGWLASVAHGRDLWVALSGVKAGGALVSRDGRRWLLVPYAPGSARKVTFGRVGGEDMFLSVGQNLRRARSLDGRRWTEIAGGGTDDPDLHAIGIGNGWAVAGGVDGRRLRTSDGVTWLDDAARGREIGSVVFWGHRFFAYEEAGAVHVSSDDGQTWAEASTNQNLARVVAGVMDGRPRLFGFSWPNHLLASDDGFTWTTLLPRQAEERGWRAITIVPAR